MSSPGDYFKLIQEDYQKVKRQLSHKPMTVVQAHEYFERHKESIVTNFSVEIRRPLNEIRFWKIFNVKADGEETIVINQSLIYVLCLYITNIERYNETVSQTPSKVTLLLNLKETCPHFFKILYIFPSALVMNKLIGVEDDDDDDEDDDSDDDDDDDDDGDDDDSDDSNDSDDSEEDDEDDKVEPDDGSNVFKDVKLQDKEDFISYNLGEVIQKCKDANVFEDDDYSLNESENIKYKCHKFNEDHLVETMIYINNKICSLLFKKSLQSLLFFYGRLLPPLFVGDYSNLLQTNSRLFGNNFFDPIVRLFQFAMDDSKNDILDSNNILNVPHFGVDNRIVLKKYNQFEDEDKSSSLKKYKYSDDEEGLSLLEYEEVWGPAGNSSNLKILHLKDQAFSQNVDSDGKSLKKFIKNSKIFHSIVSKLIKESSNCQTPNYIIITDYEFSLFINLQNKNTKSQTKSSVSDSEPITPSSSDDDDTISSGQYDLEVLMCKNVFLKYSHFNELNYNQINVIESRLMTSIFLEKLLGKSNHEVKFNPFCEAVKEEFIPGIELGGLKIQSSIDIDFISSFLERDPINSTFTSELYHIAPLELKAVMSTRDSTVDEEIDFLISKSNKREKSMMLKCYIPDFAMKNLIDKNKASEFLQLQRDVSQEIEIRSKIRFHNMNCHSDLEKIKKTYPSYTSIDLEDFLNFGALKKYGKTVGIFLVFKTINKLWSDKDFKNYWKEFENIIGHNKFKNVMEKGKID
ncbi:Replicase polyprotein [Wickerhamomyces ciferrii]|uniref:Replicase polyprotein n=1 Tax=Wickerhamomyces ciferrii (strain ATCC 14091 / BCRC 22168 / CBS 111 / JCM 3599 / NBRC 0793 / NRRL Y-1031 F-60-10) TaxID=1206466 RepID=K0KX94_WICCF|nr:Replicase polyprotein [Wickerhamomyces ciferrii]CCH46104.1 Replicase polyprotein [Wickerhamomyces ciferrii]